VDARTASSSRKAQRRGRAGGAWPPCRPIVAHLPAVVYTLLCARDATQPSSCQHTHIMSLSTINVHKQLLQQLLMIFGCQTMHNFVYLAQRRSQEFSCERNFGGGACLPLPLAAPLVCDPMAAKQYNPTRFGHFGCRIYSHAD